MGLNGNIQQMGLFPPMYSYSVSGGKDSIAMVLADFERGKPIDEMLFFDSGWESSACYSALDRLESIVGKKVNRIKPDKDFNYYFTDYEYTTKEGVRRKGFGFPAAMRRWCTGIKRQALSDFWKKRKKDNICHCIGINFDEQERCEKNKGNTRFPLCEYKMGNDDCLKLCYKYGFYSDGYYKHFNRLSCYCCPIAPIAYFIQLKRHYPDEFNRIDDLAAKYTLDDTFAFFNKTRKWLDFKSFIESFEKGSKGYVCLQNGKWAIQYGKLNPIGNYDSLKEAISYNNFFNLNL